MTDRKPFLEMIETFDAIDAGEFFSACEASTVREMREKYEAKVASDAETIDALRREALFRQDYASHLSALDRIVALESELADRARYDDDVRRVAISAEMLSFIQRISPATKAAFKNLLAATYWKGGKS